LMRACAGVMSGFIEFGVGYYLEYLPLVKSFWCEIKQ